MLKSTSFSEFIRSTGKDKKDAMLEIIEKSSIKQRELIMSTEVKTNAPNTMKESLPKTMTEQEAYTKTRKINAEDKDHHARVENGQMKVNQVLKG